MFIIPLKPQKDLNHSVKVAYNSTSVYLKIENNILFLWASYSVQ